MTIANVTLEKTAAITANNSLTNTTVILDVQSLDSGSALIGIKEAVQYVIKQCVDERNVIDPENPSIFLSDDKYADFINTVEAKAVRWWNDGAHGGQLTWYQDYTDPKNNDRIEIDISISGVKTIKLND